MRARGEQAWWPEALSADALDVNRPWATRGVGVWRRAPSAAPSLLARAAAERPCPRLDEPVANPAFANLDELDAAPVARPRALEADHRTREVHIRFRWWLGG